MRNALASLSVVFLLLASNSQAAVRGDWIGWGEWKYDGSGTKCHTVHLAFNEDSKQLVRTAGSLDCDMVFMELPPISLMKSGSSLVLDQKIVGDFTESHYHWIEPYSPTVSVEVIMDRAANHIDYHERWIRISGEVIYVIDAALFLRE